MDLPRLARTLRHLRPQQTVGRVAYRLARPAIPQLRSLMLRERPGRWRLPVERETAVVGPCRLRFLNAERDVSTPAVWNDRSVDKLWLYNLHYFDDLAAASDPERLAMRRGFVDRWIAENPPTAGNGWEPYPTSLRIVNWIKWALSGEPLRPNWRDSLAQQAGWLERRLEHHLLGNHLFANAKALVFAGLFFEGREADRWLALGLRLLGREVDEQLLADGGHFERSPMYHAIILEDLLDLQNIALAYALDDRPPFYAWRQRLPAARRWLAAMTHPDGQPSFFNDSACAIAPSQAALEAYAERLGLPPCPPDDAPLQALEASGYVRLSGHGAVAVLDVGAVGPDYLPGHAHADTLSFELSIGTERIIVNCGVSTYSSGERRTWERSTAAHSTVEIDGADSSEVWGSFRVGRRARVHDVQLHGGEHPSVMASHDGYRWRTGRPTHRRTWRLLPGRLVVEDVVLGNPRIALSRFHLGAAVSAEPAANRLLGTLRTASGRELQWRTSSPAVVAPSSWSPEFGRTVATAQIVAEVSGSLSTEFWW